MLKRVLRGVFGWYAAYTQGRTKGTRTVVGCTFGYPRVYAHTCVRGPLDFSGVGSDAVQFDLGGQSALNPHDPRTNSAPARVSCRRHRSVSRSLRRAIVRHILTPSAVRLPYTAARLAAGWHELVCATDCVCVRVWFPACVCACVFVRLRVVACAPVCVYKRAGLCARSVSAYVYLCGLSVCAFEGVRAFVHSGGLLRYSAGTCGIPRVPGRYSRALEGHSLRTHASVKRSSRGSHRLMGCTLGYLGVSPNKCVLTSADRPVHLLRASAQ
jgi:hypothetical protein